MSDNKINQKVENKVNKKQCFQEFLKYSTLSILGVLGLSCYILVDTYFVSKGLGTDGLAALNLAIPVFNFIFGVGLMLGVGGSTKFSIFKSQDEKQAMDKAFNSALVLATVLGFFFLLLGIFFDEALASLLGAEKGTKVYGMTVVYVRWLLLFAPAFIFNNVFLCFVRNDDAPRLATLAQLCGSISNIILDYVFIFSMNMGMFGAILATVFSPVISMVIMLLHKMKKRNTFHLVKKGWNKRIGFMELAIGFPSFVTEISLAVVMIVFNLIILKLNGNVGVAAYGVIANIALVVVAIYTGLGQGIQPLISKAYGREDVDYIKLILGYSIKAMLLLSLLMYGILYFLSEPIVGIFNSGSNELMQSIAEKGIKLYFIASPFVGFNVILATYFSSMERNIPANILTMLRGFILIIPMSFIMAKLLGITGVWLAYPISELVTTIIGCVLGRLMSKSEMCVQTVDNNWF